MDIDYEVFSPDVSTFAMTTLDKSKPNDAPAVPKKPSEAYRNWEKHFEQAQKDHLFDQYDWVGMDSATTFVDMMMDRVLSLNGRLGQWPQQDDYGPVITAFQQIMRALTNMKNKDGKAISAFLTGHLRMEKDEVSGRIYNMLQVYPSLQSKIPLLFSELLIAEAIDDGKGGTKYTVRTKPDRLNPGARCSLREVQSVEDITINWAKPLEGQGLSRLFK
jgi:hypothetical protein